MSIRPSNAPSKESHETSCIRAQIEAMRSAQTFDTLVAVTADDAATAASGALTHLDQLTETERSAATIGVSPDALKPIGWINRAHYSTLLKKNALDGRLTQQIESYKAVSAAVA